MKNDSNGGTELLYRELKKRLGKQYFNKINIIPSICDPQKIDDKKINVLWQHENVDQMCVMELKKHSFYSQIDHFVFISHWQYMNFKMNFDINSEKCTVIQNCINPIKFIEPSKEKNKKIKLIYTSTPWRGLDVLLDAFKLMNRDDVELEIYSGASLYGKEHAKNFDGQFENLYMYANSMKNVTRYDCVPNDKIREVVSRSDILAYPSTYMETSCLAALEALSAGCKVVTTNLGALPETCSVWASYVPANLNKKALSRQYAKTLNEEIDNFKGRNRQQSDFYNEYWTWDRRIPQWKTLFNSLIEKNK